jgi:hypothetical protein
MSGGFHVNLSFFGSVVLVKKNYPTHFCDYFLFEEEITLLLNRLELPLLKNDLYQV